MALVNGDLRAVSALCGWLVLLSCGDEGGAITPSSPQMRDVEHVDARPAVEVLDAIDASIDTIYDADTEIPPAPRSGRRMTLVDGRIIEGELVATYDHASWWVDPAPDRTFALFDSTRFAAWPDDRSIVFVDEGEVLVDETIALPDDRARYFDWLATHGIGIAQVPTDGPALVVTAHTDHHLAENGYGDFAWDLALTDETGARVQGDGLDLDDYTSWEAPVLAPVTGLVVELVHDAPDIPPGSLPAAGLAAVENLVGIRSDGAFHTYVLHLRQGSVPATLALGDRLDAGAFIGRIGNSGTTLEPHLHLVMLYWDLERARFWSVPAEMFDLWSASSMTGATYRERVAPRSGDWIAADPF